VPSPFRTSPASSIRASAGDTPTTGALAARTWLGSRGLTSVGLQRWHVDVLLDVVDQVARSAYDERVDTRFRLQIYSEEWGFMFCHACMTSRIRVHHAPMIHGRDDFGLLRSTSSSLADISTLLRSVEHRNRISFRRRNALIRTNLVAAEAAIRRWVEWL
jgi:hypothetical protein